jgi:hypothetical protein
MKSELAVGKATPQPGRKGVVELGKTKEANTSGLDTVKTIDIKFKKVTSNIVLMPFCCSSSRYSLEPLRCLSQGCILNEGVFVEGGKQDLSRVDNKDITKDGMDKGGVLAFEADREVSKHIGVAKVC